VQGVAHVLSYSAPVGGEKEAHVTTLHLTVVRAEKNVQGVAHVLSYSAPVGGEKEAHVTTLQPTVVKRRSQGPRSSHV
jgi:hypothetical protein